MAGLTLIFACVFLALAIMHGSGAAEEVCSKFSYEQEIIASVLKMKLNVEQMEQEIKKTQEDILKVLEEQREKMEKFAKDYITMRDILVVVMENKTAEVAKVLDNKTAEVDKVLRETSVVEQPKLSVAFTAHTTDHYTSKTGDQTIIFPSVVTNVGDAYNQTSGEFVTPTPGTYYFFTSILSWIGDAFWAYIAVNGSRKTTLYERGADGGYGMASQAIVIKLNEGDRVTVKTTQSGEKIFGAGYTTFSGFLIN
ncbi:complement C1q-like protein 2 [Mercenaria mercenaria]|uniref:complement C1q-like protein 2 n=1 Tax=Mercenaria mercenaria TaxID=6596 RepID=UPI00234FA019|nr:complement C1q-like protein 2 [Mercenaria mercenaria]